LHLIAQATAEEVGRHLGAAAREALAEGDLAPDLRDADLDTLCADPLAQNRIRSYLMEFLVGTVLANTDVTPASQIIYLTKGQVLPGKGFEFILSVIPSPSVELSSYEPVEAFVEELTVTTEEVTAKLMDLARGSAVAIPKPEGVVVEDGDYVEIETSAIRDGEEYEPLCARKRLYRLGEDFLPAGFDAALKGMERDETKTFALDFAEGSPPIDVTVTILGIYDENIPDPDDAWVEKKYPGLGGVAELKKCIRQELEDGKRPGYEAARTEAALKQLAQRVITPVPEEVFTTRFGEVYRSFCRGVKDHYGQGIEEYFYQQGISERQFKDEMASDVRDGLIQGLALDAYARYHGIEPEEEDYQQVLTSIAPGKEEGTRQEYAICGRTYILDEAARRAKTIKCLLNTEGL
jgi:FKBP-type peptidyl-prolyl cis-trans isomerase (trigger factor)